MENIDTNEIIDEKTPNDINGYRELVKKQRNIIRHLKAELAWTSERMVTNKKYGEFYASPEYKEFIKTAHMLLIVLGLYLFWLL